jgi:hypothetical protein
VPSQEHTEIGDALRGDTIAVEALDISPIRYGSGSGRHKIQFTKLRRNAYCVIELPLKSLIAKRK